MTDYRNFIDRRRVSVPTWYDGKRAREVLEAYNSGSGSGLAADPFVAQSIVPAGTGAARDFSYIAPDLPELIPGNCVGCMECVQNCPDSAIFGKVVTPETLEQELAGVSDAAERELLRAQYVQTTKYFDAFEKKRAKNADAPAGGLFTIAIDPTKCKGCGECVPVCGDHDALKMVKKTGENLPRYFDMWNFYQQLPSTPKAYINPKVVVDIMLRDDAILYLGGGGSCMGCGEASVIRQTLAATSERVGENFGIVASTGCNTVFGATYPYNPFLVPWTNSLFENSPTVAMGIRAFWDAQGHKDRQLWVVGGDGAMLDIGFQALSRMLTSGMNIKVLILDTQVYSNTGGQTSTATFIGQEAKMSSHGKVVMGKTERRKEIGQIAMMHPHVYVAQTVGAMSGHFYKSVLGALDFDGPAVVNVYTTCQPEHGVADDRSYDQARMAVESRAFPLFIYDPTKGRTLKQRLSLQGNPSMNRNWAEKKGRDGVERTITFADWARTEARFAKHFDREGNPSESLLRSQEDRLENWWQLQELAGIRNLDLED